MMITADSCCRFDHFEQATAAFRRWTFYLCLPLEFCTTFCQVIFKHFLFERSLSFVLDKRKRNDKSCMTVWQAV